MKYSDPALVDHLASAYVLGTLGARARRRFDRLLHDRGDIALAVAQWQLRLGQLAQSVPPIRPSPMVWHAVDARTRPAAPATGTHAPRGRFSPAGWGLGGFAAGLVAAVAFVVAVPAVFLSADRVAMQAGERLPQSYVGLLTDAKGDGRLLVSSLRHGRTMVVKVIGPPIAAPASGKLVLWAVPADGRAFMLGDVPSTGSATSRLPDTSEALLSRVRKLVVTNEVTDQPIVPGPVVFSGNCAKLW